MRTITNDLLIKLKTVRDVQFSPNGKHILYTLQSFDLVRDATFTSLWLLNIEDGGSECLVSDAPGISYPRWSPDGHWLIFVQNQHPEKASLFRMSVLVRRPDIVLVAPFSIDDPVWSPDGKYILFSATIISETDSPSNLDRVPHVIRQARYKADGMPQFLSQQSQLFRICLEDRKLLQLTSAEENAYSGRWSPDGKRIVFCRQHSQNKTYSVSAIWTMDAAGQQLSQLTQTVPHATAPTWSPDGQTIAFYGTDEQVLGEDEQFWRVWMIPAEGGDPTCLTKNYDRSVILPVRTTSLIGPIWTADGRALVVRVADRGSIHLVSIQLEDQSIQVLTPGEHQVLSFSLASSTETLVFTVTDPHNPSDIYVCNGNGSELRRLTYINQPILKSIELPVVEKRRFESPHGGTIEGWVIRPSDRQENLPLLLDIHGGPHGFIGNYFPLSRFYRYVLAARGWAVLTLNPHGSGSYSQQFSLSIHGHWGEYDLPEQMAAVDALVSEGLVDAERLAVTGYSYGGFMTTWAISHTDRFKAAVIGGAITNLQSFYGTSDIGMWFLPWEMEGDILENPALYCRLSPIHYVEKIRTPTLIMHGELDRRCSISQSEELFVRLMAIGQAPVELVCYPGCDHLFLSGGKLGYRIDYFNRLINWVEKFTLN